MHSERHQRLAWFDARTGETVKWPRYEEHGLQLATLAKGIYKPADSDLALSIRISLDSPYPDAPELSADGKWVIRYHEETTQPGGKPLFTNLGLLRCMERGVPIGVLQQTQSKPMALYKVMGLGLVTAHAYGFFTIEGPVRLSEAPSSFSSWQGELQQQLDARDRQLREVVRRQGQGAFRNELMRAYSATCALTGCNIVEVLEAAHIAPYMGQHTNSINNGLLLRADIHTLFDLGLIRIQPDDYSVTVSNGVSKYYQGNSLSLPTKECDWPSKDSLRIRASLLGPIN